MSLAKSHFYDLKPVISATHSLLGPYCDFSYISRCCPVLKRFWSFGSIGLAPSHAPAYHRWGVCWGGPTNNPASMLE